MALLNGAIFEAEGGIILSKAPSARVPAGFAKQDKLCAWFCRERVLLLAQEQENVAGRDMVWGRRITEDERWPDQQASGPDLLWVQVSPSGTVL